jgi:predicted DNA-binding WGR domain protein
MRRVRLERVRRHLDEEKFYEITIVGDMFGAWIVERRWGRIGGEGDARSASHTRLEDALAAARHICGIKLSRGYRVVADPATLSPIEMLPPEDGQTRLLRSADALERLLQSLPAYRDSRFGRIVASLATACRQRRRNGERFVPPGQRRVEWLLDDIGFRVRARIFQLLDELVSGVLTEDDEHAVFRIIQEASTPNVAGCAVRLIPRTRHALLDQRVVDLFADDRRLAEFSLDAAEHGIKFVGELVQLPLAEIMRVAKGERAIVSTLEDRLRALGLPLGGRAPKWCPPRQLLLTA